MRNSISRFVWAVALALVIVAPAWAQGADPIAVLKSNAGYQEKADACRTLQLKGQADAVPALEPLLVDEKLSHMARYALEAMPCPEAGAALRNALAKTKGNLKVGVISSLGTRKDVEAVPALIALLSDGDEVVVRAAADSLGKIGTPEAAQALQAATAKANISPAVLNGFCEGLLGCAEKAAAAGQKDAAIAAYDHLRALANAPAQVHAAALRGAALTRGNEQGTPLLAEAIRGGDKAMFNAALRAAREMEAGDAVSTAFAAELPALPAEKKVRVIEVLGQRGGAAAGPAVLAEVQAQGAPVEVRVAAINAFARMSFSPALELITNLACNEADKDVATAARNALAYFPGADGDAALTAMLKNPDAKIRLVAVELIGEGGLPKPVDLLVGVAEGDADEGIRVAAMKALGDHVGINEMPRLLDRLLKAQSSPEIRATENTLRALIARAKKTPSADVTIQKAVYGKLPDGPSADVTAKVAQIVASGTFAVDASNANFGDTAPSVPKQLRVDYTANGAPFSKTVNEGETVSLAAVAVPPAIVDALCAAQATAQGENKEAALELLSATESPKAFETVRTVATQGEGPAKDAALRVVCKWPTAEALPMLMELATTSTDPKLKVLALRGAVPLLKQGGMGTPELLQQYAVLMQNATGPDDKKLVLSGLAQVGSVDALDQVFAQFADEAVKAEALQAAVAIAKSLGNAPREDAAIFNGKDMTGWQATTPYWKIEDGAIVGQSTEQIPDSAYVWSTIEVRNFYFAADVKLEPPTANSGIQFRSKKLDEAGHALGYQGDIGQGVWGRLYHQGGRGMLDWNGRAEEAVKPGDWNRYEILAVGPIICTAINGKLGVACYDLAGKDERSGLIGFQIHAGAPQKVSYRNMKLVHDPKVEFVGMTTDQLIAELRVPKPE